MTDQQRIVLKSALVEKPCGVPVWQDNVAITIADGIIERIENENGRPSSGSYIDGVAIPSLANVHSHAFQRGFSGLSEFRTAANDSFWTWRKLMYQFVRNITPDDLYVIARQLYLEMLMAGYSWVGEFHYLHNNESGKPYHQLSEMSEALVRAADDTGIGICLLPVLYQRSGFDASSAIDDQRRFTLNNEDYFRLLDGCRVLTHNRPNATMGLAFHSLRAVSDNAIQETIQFRNEQFKDCPVHIHVAEQVQEVNDCLASTGNRPVEHLLSACDVDEHWCLIHATHLSETEIRDLAKTEATVGLCPTTESNLGDGFFPAASFLGLEGRIAIGSDSHCSIDFRDELRTLEYGQRLLHQQRAVLGTETESVGRRLVRECAASGGAAMGVPTGRIAVGNRADWIVIDDQHPTIAGASGDRLLDRLVFSNTGNPICRRMIGGDWIDNDRLLAMIEESAIAFAALNKRLLSC